jgi:hypothetical protein
MNEATDKEFEEYTRLHGRYIQQICFYEERMDELTPYELSRMEYLYTKLEQVAWQIAGWYKKRAKYHEGMAEIAQGQHYRKEREKSSATDAQHYSRIAKGTQLKIAGQYEGDFITWRGIAGTYERAANAIKDMIKSITMEE